MADILQAYKAYYRVRAERYANNPSYANSYQAEQQLAGTLESCTELAQFKDKMGNLNEECAIGLVKDEHLIEKEFYQRHEEKVRMKAAERILEGLSGCSNTTDLTTLVLDVSNKNSVEISMDEYQREFQGDWDQLDAIDIYSNAVVPAEYQQEMKDVAKDIAARIIKSVQGTEAEAQKFDPSFRFIPELNLEHRHRRLIPYTDEHLKEQLAIYKNLINR